MSDVEGRPDDEHDPVEEQRERDDEAPGLGVVDPSDPDPPEPNEPG